MVLFDADVTGQMTYPVKHIMKKVDYYADNKLFIIYLLIINLLILYH